MFIVAQNKRSVVNIDIAVRIVVKGTYIIAITDNNKASTLGSYKTEERSNEVFQEMLKELFPKETLVFQNIEVSEEAIKEIKKQGLCAIAVDTNGTPRLDIIEPRVYYMPEE